MRSEPVVWDSRERVDEVGDSAHSGDDDGVRDIADGASVAIVEAEEREVGIRSCIPFAKVGKGGDGAPDEFAGMVEIGLRGSAHRERCVEAGEG